MSNTTKIWNSQSLRLYKIKAKIMGFSKIIFQNPFIMSIISLSYGCKHIVMLVHCDTCIVIPCTSVTSCLIFWSLSIIQSVHHITTNPGKMRDCIYRDVNIIRNNPNVIQKAIGDMTRRCVLCEDWGGGHVESVGE